MSRGDSAISRQEPEQRLKADTNKSSAGQTMKRLFRDAIKAIARRDPEQQPKRRRRRGGEDTSRAFTMAKKILRPVFRYPAAQKALAFLADTLDWLHLWQHDADSNLTEEIHHHPEQNHLFPHL